MDEGQIRQIIIDPHVMSAIICLVLAVFISLGLSLFLLEDGKKR